MFKSLRILVEILFGPTVLWLFREDMSLETSLQSVGEVKNESIFVRGANRKWGGGRVLEVALPGRGTNHVPWGGKVCLVDQG